MAIVGDTRDLPEDLLLSDGYNVAVLQDAVPLLDLSDWSDPDPDVRISVTLDVSLNEYIALANCVDIGRDIAYGDNSGYLWWLWCRAVSSVSPQPPGGGNMEIAVIEERQNQGIDAGDTVGGGWVRRKLNTSVKTYAWLNLDVVNHEFMLQPGTYVIRAISTARGANYTRIALWRDTGLTHMGINGKADAPNNALGMYQINLVYPVTLTSPVTYWIEQYALKTVTNGMGMANNIPGYHETYSSVTIARIA